MISEADPERRAPPGRECRQRGGCRSVIAWRGRGDHFPTSTPTVPWVGFRWAVQQPA